jgi:ribosomal-protein-alanine N-acetyltransferase
MVLWTEVPESITVQYRFVHMTEEYADEVVHNWHYEGIYSFYDMAADEEDLRIFTNRAYWENTTFAVLNPGDDLVGWATFYVEGGDMWLSLGLKPELTGVGLGEGFVSQCVAFARSHYGLDQRSIKLDVAVFNRRAITVYERAGFAEIGRITKKTHIGEIEFLRMAQQAVPCASDSSAAALRHRDEPGV